MGLRVTHDCWDGSHSLFRDFCERLIHEAYGPEGLPADDVLTLLPTHSDNDGEIAHKDCKPLAERLLELAPKMGAFEAETRQFAFGLACAHEAGENVEFH